MGWEKERQRMAQLIDYNGKLAISWGWMTNLDKPEENRVLNVGKVSADKYKDLLGVYVEWVNNMGVAHWNGRRYVFEVEDADEWTKISETRPIKKPRDGKEYTWKWYMGQWRKEWK